MARCCLPEPIPNEFVACYASVLVYGSNAEAGLAEAVSGLEKGGAIVSCFTAWCSSCRKNYFLTSDLARFPTASAHHTHKLMLLRMLRESGVFPQ